MASQEFDETVEQQRVLVDHYVHIISVTVQSIREETCSAETSTEEKESADVG